MKNINKEFLPDIFDTFKHDIHKDFSTQMIQKLSIKFMRIGVKIDSIRFSMAKHRRQA